MVQPVSSATALYDTRSGKGHLWEQSCVGWRGGPMPQNGRRGCRCRHCGPPRARVQDGLDFTGAAGLWARVGCLLTGSVALTPRSCPSRDGGSSLSAMGHTTPHEGLCWPTPALFCPRPRQAQTHVEPCTQTPTLSTFCSALWGHEEALQPRPWHG